MKKSIALLVAALLFTLTITVAPVGAATRVGLTSGTVLGVEYEPPQGPYNLAYGLGLVQKNDDLGASVSLTKYFGGFERHTNRPYAAVRAGLLDDGGGFTYAVAGGYSISMGILQLLTNINYTDGDYGLGMGATIQF